ncbi:unnamed protein product [Arabidopsis arenosa]|uniref:Uncharacterized protein n=1 Tax=Arabidopsis arenosa TaxID=38785 RepID=A0A8S2A0Z3_ARAAE|nr:unnamed protein product [Arabidopsis arenosa]
MSSFVPIELVTEIIRRIGHNGFRELGPFIASGPEWRDMVFSAQVLREVCLDEFIFDGSLCNCDSPYRPFLLRCLVAENNTAKYVEGVRRAAQDGPSVESLDMLGEAAIKCIHSRFAFGVFLICCGSSSIGTKVLNSFMEKVPNFIEAVNIAEQVMTQIRQMGTPGKHAYRGFRGLIDIPECRLFHPTAPDVCEACFALTYVFQISDLC